MRTPSSIRTASRARMACSCSCRMGACSVRSPSSRSARTESASVNPARGASSARALWDPRLALLALLGLLAVAVAAWLAGSYIGRRRATRALLRQIQAERQLHSLNQQIGALGEQLAAEQAIL